MNSVFKSIFAVITLILVTAISSFSQVGLKVGGGLGLFSPVSDFSGSTLEYYAGTKYGVSSGLNLQAKVKAALLGFDLAGEIDYASVGGSGNSEPGQGSVEHSERILSIKAGPEFHLGLPAFPVSLYIGANLALNRFSGDVEFQGVSGVPSGKYTMTDATRIGAGIDGGGELSIGPALTLDLNISYNVLNLSGKEWTDANPAANQRLDSYLSLNDNPDPLYAPGDGKHFISTNRGIHSVLFAATILFGL